MNFLLFLVSAVSRGYILHIFFIFESYTSAVHGFKKSWQRIVLKGDVKSICTTFLSFLLFLSFLIANKMSNLWKDAIVTERYFSFLKN